VPPPEDELKVPWQAAWRYASDKHTASFSRLQSALVNQSSSNSASDGTDSLRDSRYRAKEGSL
jgi:hypothetical protein